MNRREALFLMAAAAGRPPARKPHRPKPVATAKTSLGVVIYALAQRRKAMQVEQPGHDLFEPFAFLEYCRSLGAGGVQLSLGVIPSDECRRLRDLAAQYGIVVEGIVSLPEGDGGWERFEAEVRTAAEVGVPALRTAVLPGRRYEQFNTFKEFEVAAELSRRALRRALPILERHRVRLAIENHKDRRVDELRELLTHIGSPYVGACVDFGNNFALLEDPLAVVEALAPWAFSAHIKDQAVQEFDEGFLFADVPLGQGFLDLKKMVGILRRANPQLRFHLETITRDPLQVPVLTEKYWATLPDVAGAELARTLRTVRAHRADALPQISRMSAAEQLACETAGIAQSLKFAQEELEI